MYIAKHEPVAYLQLNLTAILGGSIWLTCKGLIAQVVSPVIIGHHGTVASELIMGTSIWQLQWTSRFETWLLVLSLGPQKENILTRDNDR